MEERKQDEARHLGDLQEVPSKSRIALACGSSLLTVEQMLQFYERHVKIIKDENRALIDTAETNAGSF